MIEAISISKNFGDLQAIRDISFRIQPGEVVGLLGPNGAGKTTTMRILTGFMPPSSGKVTIAGHDLLNEPKEAKRKLGYLPENPPLYPELTVEEMLAFVAGLRGIAKNRRKEKIDEALAKTGTTEIRKRLIGHISKGYRQRVGIAQSILHEPAFLILDEPTIGLDPKQILEIRELIRSLRESSLAILLSSHILQEISLVCDRVLIIRQGQLVADGRIADLTQGRKKLLVTVHEDLDEMQRQIRDLPGVEAVEEYRSGLEEVFLQLTQESS